MAFPGAPTAGPRPGLPFRIGHGCAACLRPLPSPQPFKSMVPVPTLCSWLSSRVAQWRPGPLRACWLLGGHTRLAPRRGREQDARSQWVSTRTIPFHRRLLALLNARATQVTESVLALVASWENSAARLLGTYYIPALFWVLGDKSLLSGTDSGSPSGWRKSSGVLAQLGGWQPRWHGYEGGFCDPSAWL